MNTLKQFNLTPDSDNGRTHGVVYHNGLVYLFRQSKPSILIYDNQGVKVNAWGDFPGAHGITLSHDKKDTFLWLTDEFSGRVEKYTLDGDLVLSLNCPMTERYQVGYQKEKYINQRYSPTVAVELDEINGGNGEIWVCDGYGMSVVNRYSPSGEFIRELTGEERGHRFYCNHGILFDTRKSIPNVIICDRANQRLQVYDINGVLIELIEHPEIKNPSGLAIDENNLYIAELKNGIVCLDKNNLFIKHLHKENFHRGSSDWPNISFDKFSDQSFVSPHGICLDDEGDIYIAEWVKGGLLRKIRNDFIQ